VVVVEAVVAALKRYARADQYLGLWL